MTQRDTWEHLDTIRAQIAGNDRIVLCLDFDGTLVPIVDDPDAATIDADTRGLLERIATENQVQVAVVSGRALEDVRTRVGIEGITYAGNHGLELQEDSGTWVHPVVEDVRPCLARAIDELESDLATIPGAFVEDKFATATVHFRQVPSARTPDVRDRVRERIAPVDELRLETGKAVLQIRPRIDWDKGDAIRRIVDPPAPGTTTIYIGDDRTDADGFDGVRTLGGEGITIAVGDADLPADFGLSSTADVHRWLEWFARTTGAVNTDLSV